MALLINSSQHWLLGHKPVPWAHICWLNSGISVSQQWLSFKLLHHHGNCTPNLPWKWLEYVRAIGAVQIKGPSDHSVEKNDIIVPTRILGKKRMRRNDRLVSVMISKISSSYYQAWTIWCRHITLVYEFNCAQKHCRGACTAKSAVNDFWPLMQKQLKTIFAYHPFHYQERSSEEWC